MKQVCDVLGKCGGCAYIGLEYEQSLSKKEALVKKLLSMHVKVSPIIPMEKPFNYRNKVHLTFGEDRKGNVFYGTYAEGTHKIIPAKRCYIEFEEARKIADTLVKLLPSFKLKPYDEDRHRGFLRHILVRKAFATGEIMLVLVAGTNVFPSKKNFIGALLKMHPEISTIVFNINDRNTSMVLGNREEVLFGKGYIEDVLCGKNFKISPKSFYQVNHDQTEVLYSLAVELANLTGSESVIDAYCGTGTIGIVASDSAKSVLGIELNSDAVRDAKTNAKANGVSNITFVCEDATRHMVYLASKGYKADVVLMDPPRSGSTKEFIDALKILSPKRIVYVSCNPETLARDIGDLKQAGFIPKKCVPVDMFPWTRDVETVCLLSKGDVKSKKIRVEFSLEDMDTDGFKKGATYNAIRDWIKEKYGYRVTNLNIAQVKQKHGIIERENYNKPKSPDSKQPGCPEEKVKAIEDAMRHFQMI